MKHTPDVREKVFAEKNLALKNKEYRRMMLNQTRVINFYDSTIEKYKREGITDVNLFSPNDFGSYVEKSIECGHIEDACSFIRKRKNPPAVYVFPQCRDHADKILSAYGDAASEQAVAFLESSSSNGHTFAFLAEKSAIVHRCIDSLKPGQRVHLQRFATYDEAWVGAFVRFKEMGISFKSRVHPFSTKCPAVLNDIISMGYPFVANDVNTAVICRFSSDDKHISGKDALCVQLIVEQTLEKGVFAEMLMDESTAVSLAKALGTSIRNIGAPTGLSDVHQFIRACTKNEPMEFVNDHSFGPWKDTVLAGAIACISAGQHVGTCESVLSRIAEKRTNMDEG